MATLTLRLSKGSELTHAELDGNFTNLNNELTAEVAVNSQSGTTYTLVLADKGRIIETTNASAVTVTVPTNAGVAFPVGSMIEVYQAGAGTVTIAGAGGVTLQGSPLTTAGQHKSIFLRKRATDTWSVQ